jgi:8-oxo-dGTP pyrophosphatase MutT (NUDIX family)
MGLRDGDGWVRCDCGGHHWGLHGAAGLLLVRRDTPEPHVLLQLRAEWTHGGGTWALPGGALDSHEDSIAAAKREAF